MTYLNENAAEMSGMQISPITDVRFSNKKLALFALVGLLFLPLPYLIAGFDAPGYGVVFMNLLSPYSLFLIFMSILSAGIVLPLFLVILLLFIVPKFLKRFYSYFLYIFIVLFGLIPTINAYLVAQKSTFSINSVLDTQLIFPFSFLWSGEMLGFYPEYLISYYFGFFMYVCIVCIFLWRNFFKKEGVFGIATEKVLGVSMLLFVCALIYAYLLAQL